VVMLHGGFGTAELAEKAYGWDELAERAGFIVVYPDGVDRTWNAGSCCGRSAKTGVDDVGFIAAVVAELSRQVAIDPQRRYAAGMSNGAMMAYRLARQTTLFAAIAPVSGTQLATCDHAQPTSVLHLHGSTDPRVRLDGKPGDGASAVTGPPISTVLDGWRARDRCGAFTTTLDGPLTTAKADCPSGREVRWVVIAGLGHEWPTPSASGSSLDATTAIWDFFAAHPKSPG
jgi:polyhydroxybutyrate depolymerase